MTAERPLEGKVALVTGAARRVGRAVALALARAGMDVAFTFSRSTAEAASLAEEVRGLGRRASAISADFARPDIDDVVEERFRTDFDRMDALVNNASSFDASPLGAITPAIFDHHMAVNARAPLLLIQRFAPLLGAHHRPDDPSSTGRVVNFIDIHVMGEPLRHYGAYSASKAALMEITAVCAVTLAPRITVNAIAPGVVAWSESYTEKEREIYMQKVPLDRPGTPEDAASAVLFLVRDAHYCTGQIIRLDGGRLLT